MMWAGLANSPQSSDAPAELDMEHYFRVSPPTVHRMVIELEKRGLIARTPRQARSIELLIPPELLPALR